MSDDNTPSWLERQLSGAWDGWSGFWQPTAADVPQKALYDADTLGAARMSALGNFGATLLAASQGGQTYNQRAALLGQLGGGMDAYNKTLDRGAQNAVARAQLGTAQAQLISAQTKQQQLAGWQDTLKGLFQQGIPTGDQQTVAQTVSNTVPSPVTPIDQFGSRLGRREGGSRADIANSAGYSGQYQMGTARLADLGFYQPAEGESLKTNQWQGTLNIPGFPQVRTQADFLASPEAQQVVFGKHMSAIDAAIDKTPGAETMSRDGLRAVAHLGGVGGMQRFVSSGGLYDPADSNGTHLSGYYRQFSAANQQPTGASPSPAPAPQTQQQVVQGFIAGLDPDRRRILYATLSGMDREEGSKKLLDLAMSNESYQTLSPTEAQRVAGGAYNPRAVYQRNSRTGQITIQATPEERVTYRALTPQEVQQRGLDPSRQYQVSSAGQVEPMQQGRATMRQLTPEEVRQRGLDARQGWQIDSDGKVTQIGGGGTNVTLNTDNATMKYSFETLGRERQAIEAQRPAMAQLQQMMDLVSSGMKSGNLENLTMNFRGWLNTAGILSADDKRNYTMQELFEQASKKLIPASLPPGAASDTDVKLAMRANPTLDNTPQGIMLKAAVAMQAIRYNEERLAAMEVYATTPGPDGQTRGVIGFDQQWRKEHPQIIPRVESLDETKDMQPGTVVKLPSGMPDDIRKSYPHYPFYIVGAN